MSGRTYSQPTKSFLAGREKQSTIQRRRRLDNKQIKKKNRVIIITIKQFSYWLFVISVNLDYHPCRLLHGHATNTYDPSRVWVHHEFQLPARENWAVFDRVQFQSR